MNKELKVGDKVSVLKRVGKDDTGTIVNGTIEKFNSVIRIEGEETATVRYGEGKDNYGVHKLSSITQRYKSM